MRVSDATLSGIPSNTDAGANAFTVQVDATGGSDTVTLNITVINTNDAPTFTVDPISSSNATEGAAYSDTIAGTATDIDAGDTLTYSKVSGPTWLSVAANGALSATPAAGDVGAKTFTVEFSDGNGGTDQATLNITVDAAPAGTMHVSDIQVDRVNLGRGQSKSQAAVTIVDSVGNPVSNATVTVSFTGAIVETKSGVTDANG